MGLLVASMQKLDLKLVASGWISTDSLGGQAGAGIQSATELQLSSVRQWSEAISQACKVAMAHITPNLWLFKCP